MPSVLIRSPWLCFVFIVQIREMTLCLKSGLEVCTSILVSAGLALLYLPALSGDNKNEGGKILVIMQKVHIVPQQEEVMCTSQSTASKQW